jgi:hypothetical protein
MLLGATWTEGIEVIEMFQHVRRPGMLVELLWGRGLSLLGSFFCYFVGTIVACSFEATCGAVNLNGLLLSLFVPACTIAADAVLDLEGHDK